IPMAACHWIAVRYRTPRKAVMPALAGTIFPQLFLTRENSYDEVSPESGDWNEGGRVADLSLTASVLLRDGRSTVPASPALSCPPHLQHTESRWNRYCRRPLLCP